MNTTSNWIPNVHPIFVHFPIALFFVAMGIELFELILKKSLQYSFIADIVIWTGTLFGIFSVISGLQAANSIVPSDEVKAAVESHKLVSIVTIVFFVLYSVVRILRYRSRIELKPKVAIAILILGCIGLFGVYKAGEKGAMLVYKYGIGVRK